MSKTDRPKFARNKYLHEEKDRKRREAAERQAIYDGLTVAQKLERLGDRPAAKQRAKLARQAEYVQATQVAVSFDAATKADVVLKVERKGQKAKRQARKDKKSNA